MSQFNWTYLAPSGKKHQVGLFHGDRTGHVMIYCDLKVVLVDFKVRETKSYSIFIEDELCEINIERQKDRFVYGFDINKEVDTPLNRERKATNKKHLRQGIAFIAGIALLVAMVLLGAHQFKQESYSSFASMLAASGKETNAKIFLSNSEEATYNFVADGKVYSKKTPFNLDVSILLENGMPIEDGDEFLVKYYSPKPEVNKILLNKPTEKQIGIYDDRATEQHHQLNPNLSYEYCDCLTDVAYEMEGIIGYAKFYLQDQSYYDNPRYNSDSFKRLIRSVPFQKKAEEKCWEKR